MVTPETVAVRKNRRPQRFRARSMRNIPTLVERKFWWEVRDRRLGGFKFKRQYLIGGYIVDFVCLQCTLVIELDGSQHAGSKLYDQERDHWLKQRGYRVLRVWNNRWIAERESVLQAIFNLLSD